VIDKIDPRARRPGAAVVDHRQHIVFQPDEQSLDRAVAAIAHPALQAALQRRHFGPGAKSDALHPAADQDIAVHGQESSPSLR